MNLIQFPQTSGAMSDAELGYHASGALGKLLEENLELECERDIYRSAWHSATRRLGAAQVRRLRWLLAGSSVGFALALILDGTVARVLS